MAGLLLLFQSVFSGPKARQPNPRQQSNRKAESRMDDDTRFFSDIHKRVLKDEDDEEEQFGDLYRNATEDGFEAAAAAIQAAETVQRLSFQVM